MWLHFLPPTFLDLRRENRIQFRTARTAGQEEMHHRRVEDDVRWDHDASRELWPRRHGRHSRDWWNAPRRRTRKVGQSIIMSVWFSRLNRYRCIRYISVIVYFSVIYYITIVTFVIVTFTYLYILFNLIRYMFMMWFTSW